MPTIVELPDKTEIEFPDGMDEKAIQQEISKSFPKLAAPTPRKEEGKSWIPESLLPQQRLPTPDETPPNLPDIEPTILRTAAALNVPGARSAEKVVTAATRPVKQMFESAMTPSGAAALGLTALFPEAGAVAFGLEAATSLPSTYRALRDSVSDLLAKPSVESVAKAAEAGTSLGLTAGMIGTGGIAGLRLARGAYQRAHAPVQEPKVVPYPPEATAGDVREAQMRQAIQQALGTPQTKPLIPAAAMQKPIRTPAQAAEARALAENPPAQPQAPAELPPVQQGRATGEDLLSGVQKAELAALRAQLAEARPPKLPKPTVPETPPEPQRNVPVLAEIRAANARTKEAVRKLYPQLSREQAAQLRDLAFPDEPSWQRLVQWADKNIHDKLGGTSANPFADPGFMASALIKGVDLISKGVRPWGVWAEEMVKQFGEEVRGHLHPVYIQAVREYEQRKVQIQRERLSHASQDTPPATVYGDPRVWQQGESGISGGAGGRGRDDLHISATARQISGALRQGNAIDLQHVLSSAAMGPETLRGLFSQLSEAELSAIQALRDAALRGRSISEAAREAIAVFNRQAQAGGSAARIPSDEAQAVTGPQERRADVSEQTQREADQSTQRPQPERIRYASENQETATLYGSLRAFPESRLREVSLQEGGARIQPFSETEAETYPGQVLRIEPGQPAPFDIDPAQPKRSDFTSAKMSPDGKWVVFAHAHAQIPQPWPEGFILFNNRKWLASAHPPVGMLYEDAVKRGMEFITMRDWLTFGGNYFDALEARRAGALGPLNDSLAVSMPKPPPGMIPRGGSFAFQFYERPDGKLVALNYRTGKIQGDPFQNIEEATQFAHGMAEASWGFDRIGQAHAQEMILEVDAARDRAAARERARQQQQPPPGQQPPPEPPTSGMFDIKGEAQGTAGISRPTLTDIQNKQQFDTRRMRRSREWKILRQKWQRWFEEAYQNQIPNPEQIDLHADESYATMLRRAEEGKINVGSMDVGGRMINFDRTTTRARPRLTDIPPSPRLPRPTDEGPFPGPGAMGITPQPPEWVKKFVESEVLPFIEGTKDAGKAFGELMMAAFAPVSSAERAGQGSAVDVLFKAKGAGDKANNLAAMAFDKMFDQFKGMPRADQIDFIDRMSTGSAQATPDLEIVAQTLRDWHKRLIDEAKVFDPSIDYGDHLMHVMWSKVPGRPTRRGLSRQQILSKRPWRGSMKFEDENIFGSFKEGLANGGVPVTYNPIELFLLYHQDVQKFISANRAWGQLQNTAGTLTFVPAGDVAPMGYTPINDRIARAYFRPPGGQRGMAGEWYAQKDVARMINNYLSQDWIRNNAAGQALMKIKNISTAVELGLSPFHAVFETLETIGSMIGLGVVRMSHGEVLGGLKNILVGAPLSPFRLPKEGGSLIKYVKDKAEFAAQQPELYKWFTKHYPNADVLVDDLFTGGVGRLGLHDDWRWRMKRSFSQAWNEGDYGSALAPWRSIPAINEKLMHPLFEVYIPRLKFGMWLREYSYKLRQHQADLASGKLTREALARQTWSFIEDRFGEMNFDNLFWNRTFKSSMQLLFRSVTWKLGNTRGFGKAAIDFKKAGVDIAHGKWPDVTLPMGWMAGMALVTGTMSTLVTLAMTGRTPWQLAKSVDELLLNLTFPRISTTDPSQRVSIPTYARDAVHLYHSPTGYVTSSMTGEIDRIWDVMKNRDFYGTQVWNPDDPYYRKAWDIIAHLMPLPFGLTSSIAASRTGATGPQKILGFAGFTKAPYYVSYTPGEQKALELVRSNMKQGSRTHEAFERSINERKAVEAIRRGDTTAETAVADGLIRRDRIRVIKQRATDSLVVHAARRLDAKQAMELWAAASPTERQEIERIVRQKIRNSRTEAAQWKIEALMRLSQ